ncbi:MAG: purine-nucleoside phosphorylase [Gemmatimonadota bacterium]
MDPSRGAEVLAGRLGTSPELLIVLGSGLSSLADALEDSVSLGFDEVPGFPEAGVAGHPGRYVAGRLEGRRVLIQQGRFHYYEGHGDAIVTAPTRMAAALGIDTVIHTNASGGIRGDLTPGTLLLVEDHLNLQGRTPLEGAVRSGEARFPDMSCPYDPELARIAEAAASHLGISLPRGCYGGVLGPNFETPAEVRMLKVLGAHVVGMSTVPEVIVARALGLRVLALSVVVNPASGLTPNPLSHEEVLEAGQMASGALLRLIREIVRRIPGVPQSG